MNIIDRISDFNRAECRPASQSVELHFTKPCRTEKQRSKLWLNALGAFALLGLIMIIVAESVAILEGVR